MKRYPSITSVPEHVNLAVVATPARSVPEVVEACGQVGVEGVVIISAGFEEIGEEGGSLLTGITALPTDLHIHTWLSPPIRRSTLRPGNCRREPKCF